MNVELRLSRAIGSLLAVVSITVAPAALAQYCPGASTYFAANHVTGCTVGSCWSQFRFAGSTPISGSYPAPNYACATTSPAAGAVENTLYGYDANGNLTSSKNPLGRTTTNTFDSLSRMTQVLDPSGGRTRYVYDGNDGLMQVVDPRNRATSYTINGFGETTAQSSPDTGTTTNTYEASGNLKTRLDARGVTATYAYDGINRVKGVVYSKSGTTSESHTFTYDGGTTPPPYSKGRLTQITDTAGTTKWTYEAHGRVLTKTQTIGYTKSINYGWTAGGQLASITTPSGQVIGYGYSNSRASTLTINGAPLISAATTTPFGPLTAWRWGNGMFTFRDYDRNGRLRAWEFRNGTSILRNDLTWDIANRITAITDPAAPSLRCLFQYDSLDRLTVSQNGNPITSTQQFGFDAVGNRLNFTKDGALTNFGYSASSNQLLNLTGAISRNYVYDAAGNPTTIGSLTYVYNNANRLVSVQNGATIIASYKLNALGQRIEKSVGGVVTRFWYDEQGRLLGEYDAAGKLIQETIWLEDLPVATLRPRPGSTTNPIQVDVYYVHADHLGSPRAVTRPTDNKIVWRWNNIDPFGNNAANENPSALGTFKYALRFPGQYYDAETGTHYNYFRDYDPAIGRYQQSDPIGMDGGLNTYNYVGANALSLADPRGLMGRSAGTGKPAPPPYGRGGSGRGHNLMGCGPNGQLLENFIPDNWGFVSFRQCCDDHDNCYDDCKNKPTRDACDQAFCSCLKKACDVTRKRRGGAVLPECSGLASVYCSSVTSGGKQWFDTARRKCC